MANSHRPLCLIHMRTYRKGNPDGGSKILQRLGKSHQRGKTMRPQCWGRTAQLIHFTLSIYKEAPMPRILISLTLSAFFLLACGDSPIAPTNQPTMKPSGRSDWDASWCGGDASYQIAGTWRAANISSLSGDEYSYHLELSYDPQEQCEFYWSYTRTDSGEKVHGRSRGTFIVIDARETGDVIVLTIEGRRSYHLYIDNLFGINIETNDWEILGPNKVTLWRDQQTDLLHFTTYFIGVGGANPTFSRVVEDD